LAKIETMHGIDLDIKHGEFVVFVGPSGCGKSTLLRLIAGLEEITEGDIYIGGKHINNVDPAERGVAMVFQTYALYPHMTVEQNMGFGLKMNGHAQEEVQHRVKIAAQTLQLEDYLDRKPKALSGGQRQRVAIGRAIVRDPQVFLFDEPLSNLDAELRVEMRLQIAKLHQDLKTTMVYVTHDQVEAMTLADKIVVLRDGIVEQVGAPLHLYNKPDNLFVAGFIGSPKMNFIPVTVTQVQTKQINIKLPDGQDIPLTINKNTVKIGDQLTLGIRPEHIVVGESEAIKIKFHSQVVERLGNSTYMFGKYHNIDGFKVYIPGDQEIERGKTINLSFHYDHCHLFDSNEICLTS